MGIRLSAFLVSATEDAELNRVRPQGLFLTAETAASNPACWMAESAFTPWVVEAAPTSVAASVISADNALPLTVRATGTAPTSDAAREIFADNTLLLTVRVVGTAPTSDAASVTSADSGLLLTVRVDLTIVEGSRSDTPDIVWLWAVGVRASERRASPSNTTAASDGAQAPVPLDTRAAPAVCPTTVTSANSSKVEAPPLPPPPPPDAEMITFPVPVCLSSDTFAPA